MDLRDKGRDDVCDNIPARAQALAARWPLSQLITATAGASWG